MASCVCGFAFFSGVDRHAAECPIAVLTKERDVALLQIDGLKKDLQYHETVCWPENDKLRKDLEESNRLLREARKDAWTHCVGLIEAPIPGLEALAKMTGDKRGLAAERIKALKAAATSVRESMEFMDAVQQKQETEKRNHEVIHNEPPRRVVWFAEVYAASKAACFACKDLKWPNPGWISSKGNYLTSDPNDAKWWETSEQAVAFCVQAHVRHWHLDATEHMFVG